MQKPLLTQIVAEINKEIWNRKERSSLITMAKIFFKPVMLQLVNTSNWQKKNILDIINIKRFLYKVFADKGILERERALNFV